MLGPVGLGGQQLLAHWCHPRKPGQLAASYQNVLTEMASLVSELHSLPLCQSACSSAPVERPSKPREWQGLELSLVDTVAQAPGQHVMN